MSHSTRLNCYVAHPVTGVPYRPMLTVVLDPRSGRIVSGRVH